MEFVEAGAEAWIGFTHKLFDSRFGVDAGATMAVEQGLCELCAGPTHGGWRDLQAGDLTGCVDFDVDTGDLAAPADSGDGSVEFGCAALDFGEVSVELLFPVR
ncbi:hypothetical protein [Nocardia arthritidis]|uniref:Uncharacterized protein n=1 Tax=Nocardia arthritidis TaxID=228602 RepID=A0A6G9Y4E6_9NOCA|nr:hypothetical protein [Nocardia arthritidis]QIS07946.1 hypothetical protein F5544_00050 [Nocardia arthritidis]